MNENVEKAKVVAEQGKAAAMSAYKKGNEMMDKVSFLKSPAHKKLAWGVLAVIVLVLFLRMCGCGGSPEPFDVAREVMLAIPLGDVETLLDNLYMPEEISSGIANASKEERAFIKKGAIEGLMSDPLSDEERAIMIEKLSEMKHVSTKIDGDVATVEVIIGQAFGGEANKTLKLRKINGDWKMDITDLR